MSAPRLRREWAACAAIARHAVQAHPSKGGITLSRALAGFGVLMAVIAFLVRGEHAFTAVTVLAGMAVSFLVILWWGQLIGSVAQQNLGSNRLVPGIGRRSVKVLAAGWLAGILCASLPFAVAGLPILPVIGVAALVLTTIAMGTVRPIIFYLIMGIFWLPSLIDRHLMPLSDNTVLFLRIAFGLWIVIVTVRALQGRPSTGLLPQVVRLEPVQAKAVAPDTAYARKLRQDGENGDASALLLHGLGPAMRMMSSVRVAVPVALAAGLTIASPSLFATYRGMPGLHFLMPSIAIILQLALARSMSAAVRDTAAEQALVVLTARRPPADAVNALLARALTLRYCLAWLASTLTVLVVSALLGAEAGKLTWMLAACLAALSAGALMLQNFAAPPQRSTALKAIMIFGAAVTLIGAFSTGGEAGPAAVFAAAWSAWMLLVFALRWRAMLRAPVAFPAGRYT